MAAEGNWPVLQVKLQNVLEPSGPFYNFVGKLMRRIVAGQLAQLVTVLSSLASLAPATTTAGLEELEVDTAIISSFCCLSNPPKTILFFLSLNFFSMYV